jgi:pimeloyl-ACP methyl ester carboxylesterase
VPALARPPTHYTRSDGVDIAYQTVGEGPHDIVFVPGVMSHVELWWEEPAFAETFAGVAEFARLILFDRRGTGLSGGEAVPTLDQRMGEITAVLDAVGSRRAVMFGPADGAPAAALFAATRPDRCSGLVLYGVQATGLRDEDYPWGVSAKELELILSSLSYEWGSGVTLAIHAPSVADEDRVVEWWARMERLGIRPGQVRDALRATARTDIRDVLGTISVPTRLIHCSGDLVAPIEGARYVADRISGARLVELPGGDHLPVFAHGPATVAEVERFLSDLCDAPAPSHRLGTVVAAEATEPSTDDRERLTDVLVRFQATAFAAQVEPGGPLIAQFEGAVAAVTSASAMRDEARQLGIDMRFGLHTGECRSGNGAVSGRARDIAVGLMGEAEPLEVLGSRSVRALLAGFDVELQPNDSLTIRMPAETLPLFALASAKP